MKVWTFSSPSHLALLREHFVDSFPFDDLSLNIQIFPQRCGGDYNCAGWREAMADKMVYLVDSCVASKDILIHADSDIRFYRPIAEECTQLMHGYDLLFQNDGGDHCMGFIVIRPTEAVITFFRRVLEAVRQGSYEHDQRAANALLPTSGLRYGKLPRAYWTHGADTGKRWQIGQPIPTPPRDIAIHHGNWCVGLETKAALLANVAHIATLQSL
jgi:hypothetical protein